MCPARAQRPAWPRCYKLSSNEIAARAEPARTSRPIKPGPTISRTIRTARRAICARPSAARLDSIPSASSAAPAPTICCICSPHAYLVDGDEAIHTTHGFLIYPIVTLGAGAKPIVAPETNYTADVDAILAAVTKKTKIVFLANPNNPTGTCLSFDEVKRLHRGLPAHVLLVLDAAYAEYVQRNDYEAGIELGRDIGKCRHVPHVLENSRACGAAARLDVRPGAHSSMPSTAFAARSTRAGRRSRPASRRSRTLRTRSARASTIRAGSTG